MGHEREIINQEFKDLEEIDTEEDIKHDSINKSRKRNELKSKGKKVQIWVKKRL